MLADTPDTIASLPHVVQFSRRLLQSYRQLVGFDLIDITDDDLINSQRLFAAPFVVVAHGIQPDPVLCYGNLTALKLWEMSWEQLTSIPSRLTAEPGAREERERLLHDALTTGFSKNYSGVRVSSTGRRFWIEGVTVWNVLDETGNRIGQAATFSQWQDNP